MTALPPPPKRFLHHASFSYSSKDGDYVSAVKAALPPAVDVFDYIDGAMWGGTLVKEIEHRYRYDAPFCVVFLSKDYLKSPHATQELAVVHRVSQKKPGYMLPVVLDGTIVPEIEGIVWLDKSLTPAELAARLVDKIRQPPPKPWWFYVSAEVKIAIAAALLALIVFARPAIDFFRPSRTAIQSVDVSAQALTAHVVNRGPKSATLIGQRLIFGALPIEDKELRLEKSASATIAPGERDVKLIALELLTKCNEEGIRPNKYTIESLLNQQPVTLVIDVRESDDAPGQSTRRSMTFPAERLKPFVRKWVSGRDTPC